MKFILLIYISFLISSCTTIHSLYVPTMINTPNFNDSNNYQINAGIGYDHIDAQLAVRPYKNIGLMCNSYLSARGNNTDISIGYYRNNLFGSTIGFDIFAGYGAGGRNYFYRTEGYNLSSKSPYQEYNISNVFNKFITQVSIYNTFNKHHQISLTLRETEIYFNRFNYGINYFEGSSSSSNPLKDVYYENDKMHVTNFDLAFTYRYRLRAIGFFLQPLVLFNDWSGKNPNTNIYFFKPVNFNVNTGITIYLGRNKRD